jgi:hypothetical protein
MQMSQLTELLRGSESSDITSSEPYARFQLKILAAGLGSLVSGLCVLGASYAASESSGATMLLGSALLSLGILTMTVADADIDQTAQKHEVFPTATGVFALLFGAISPVAIPTMVVCVLPPLYLFYRWRQVLDMDEGYPKFTKLISYFAGLSMIGLAMLNWYITAGGFPHHLTTRESAYVQAPFYTLAGAVIISILHTPALGSDTRRLFIILYVLNAFLGVGFTIIQNADNGSGEWPKWRGANGRWPAVAELTGPIFYLPTLTVVLFNSQLKGCLGRYWLKQRAANAHLIADAQGIAPHHGNHEAVEGALAARADLNGYNRHEGMVDAFTLLILACFNGHEDAVDLLLGQDGVQVNKGSRHQNWTPLYVAAMRGNSLIVRKLIDLAHADVHAKTEDHQSAMLAAITFGHTEITQQLIEAGARKQSVWMGVDASAAAEKLGYGDRTTMGRALTAYESHFQGYIRGVQDCACVASWPGIYAKCW